MSRFPPGPARAVGLRIALAALAALAASVAVIPAQAQAPAAVSVQPVAYDIPAQPLSSALTEFARQSDQELFYLPEMAEGKSSAGASGRMTAEQAIAELLQGTGLEFERAPTGALLVGSEADLARLRAEIEARQGAESGANGAANTVVPTSVPPADIDSARRAGVEEIIVTGQKKAERLQDVPIAISAFSMEDLDAQKIEGGFDLLKAIPNVTFSKTNFSGYNFQIRGIGTQAVSATTDPAVAVSFNNTALIVNRLFEQEYLDVERVEVLRGPQGTLYGRNATAGVINVITNKAVLGDFGGDIKLETGNYQAQRLRGHVNVPLGDSLAVRAAYAMTEREGFATNLFDGSDIDGRDLWTGRLSLGWQPQDDLRIDLIWERFREDDNRVRSAKALCKRDPGPEFIGDVEVATIGENQPFFLGPNAVMRKGGFFNQGCLPESLYSADSYQAPNGIALPAVMGVAVTSVIGGRNGPFENTGNVGMGFRPNGYGDCVDAQRTVVLGFLKYCEELDPFGNRAQAQDLRTTYQPIAPEYRAESDIYNLSIQRDLNHGITLVSETVYLEDRYFASQDFNRFETTPNIFEDFGTACDSFNAYLSAAAPCNAGQYQDGFYARLTPGGIFTDPQLGPSSSMIIQDLSRSRSTQLAQELRLVSDFEGPWNFSAGLNYVHFESVNDYFVFSNLFTAIAQTGYFRGAIGGCEVLGVGCVYVDPRPLSEVANDPNPEGHNYFLSKNPFELHSAAVFGEVYWSPVQSVKVTAGLRISWDRKRFQPIPSQLLLYDFRDDQPFSALPSGQEPGAAPEHCRTRLECRSAGTAPGGRGFAAEPDIIQTWREPTGRLGIDWKVDTRWTDETLLYAFYTRGYKAGGANPPPISAPSGLFVKQASEAVTQPTFDAEYVNAFEVGSKNTLLDGLLMLNGSAFFYDYTDYQVSRIIDRQAVNANFDARIWGVEMEALLAPTADVQLNVALGYLNTRIADGEEAIDILDRAQGGTQSFTTPDGVTYEHWMVMKPWIQDGQNCIAPVELVEQYYGGSSPTILPGLFCLGGNNQGQTVNGYDPGTDAPNAGAGFAADLSGHELPNAPALTASLGLQVGHDVGRHWRVTGRVDHYWQDESFHRVFNTDYDRLESWHNTNLSAWLTNDRHGVTIEAYIKNVFDEAPITGAFLNSEEVGLSTNVFTLDPRLVGISLKKEF